MGNVLDCSGLPPARRQEIGRDRAHRRSTRRMFTFVVQDLPYRSLADRGWELSAVSPMMAKGLDPPAIPTRFNPRRIKASAEEKTDFTCRTKTPAGAFRRYFPAGQSGRPRKPIGHRGILAEVVCAFMGSERIMAPLRKSAHASTRNRLSRHGHSLRIPSISSSRCRDSQTCAQSDSF